MKYLSSINFIGLNIVLNKREQIIVIFLILVLKLHVLLEIVDLNSLRYNRMYVVYKVSKSIKIEHNILAYNSNALNTDLSFRAS